jgi:hypothetical protein
MGYGAPQALFTRPFDKKMRFETQGEGGKRREERGERREERGERREEMSRPARLPSNPPFICFLHSELPAYIPAAKSSHCSLLIAHCSVVKILMVCACSGCVDKTVFIIYYNNTKGNECNKFKGIYKTNFLYKNIFILNRRKYYAH